MRVCLISKLGVQQNTPVERRNDCPTNVQTLLVFGEADGLSVLTSGCHSIGASHPVISRLGALLRFCYQLEELVIAAKGI